MISPSGKWLISADCCLLRAGKASHALGRGWAWHLSALVHCSRGSGIYAGISEVHLRQWCQCWGAATNADKHSRDRDHNKSPAGRLRSNLICEWWVTIRLRPVAGFPVTSELMYFNCCCIRWQLYVRMQPLFQSVWLPTLLLTTCACGSFLHRVSWGLQLTLTKMSRERRSLENCFEKRERPNEEKAED